MGKKQRNPGDSWTLGTVRGTDPDRAYQIEAFVCSWTGLEWPIATHSAKSQHTADTLSAVPPSEKEEPCNVSWQCLLVTPPGVREKGTVRPSDRQAVQGTIGMYRDG